MVKKWIASTSVVRFLCFSKGIMKIMKNGVALPNGRNLVSNGGFGLL